MNQLPIEIWRAVLELLPLSQQRKCLFVSRLHHDLAIQLLFSVVKLDILGMNVISDEKDVALMSRSWEILDHITRTPKFANVVKKMAIRTYDVGHMIFERRESVRR
jgi:hypothetical protein